MSAYKIVKIWEHEVVHITDVRALERKLEDWKRCSEMLYESLNPPQGPSGDTIIDQLRDAEELFRKLKEAEQPVVPTTN